MNFKSFIINASIVFVVLISPADAHAQAWQGRVVDVADGDTLTIELLLGGERVKVRLHGIDAPERKQPYGESARGFLFDLALYKAVSVEERGRDRYGRTVAIVRLPSGESLQTALIEMGLAWVWPRYCHDCHEWQALQEDARNAGRGLWIDADAIPPWEWRKANK